MALVETPLHKDPFLALGSLMRFMMRNFLQMQSMMASPE
jgi:hypothetical protein